MACGFSTDGRIDTLGLRILEDDRKFFPHYDAGVLARAQLFERIPALRELFEKFHGAITEKTMRQLNRRVDQDGLTPEAVALEFLRRWSREAGIDWQEKRTLSKRADLDTPDLVIGELKVREDLCTRPAVLHGGAYMAFADTIGAIATVANLKDGETTTTIESKTNFFAAIPLGDTARAECTPLHKGRTTMVWQTKITRGDGKLAGLVTQTQMVLKR